MRRRCVTCYTPAKGGFGLLRPSFPLPPASLQFKVRNLIHGELRDSASTEWMDVKNPATQAVVCRVPCSTQQEVGDLPADSIGGR